jgi:hypothetical protein
MRIDRYVCTMRLFCAVHVKYTQKSMTNQKRFTNQSLRTTDINEDNKMMMSNIAKQAKQIHKAFTF